MLIPFAQNSLQWLELHDGVHTTSTHQIGQKFFFFFFLGGGVEWEEKVLGHGHIYK